MNRLFKIIQCVEGFLLAFAIIAIASLTILNVFARSLLGFSFAFTEELCQFLIVLVTFAGLSYGASKGRHIRMTALYDLLGGRARKAAMIGIAGFTALLLFWLAGYAVNYVLVVRRLGSVSPVLQVPLYLVYLAAPAGLVLAGIQYSLAVAQNLRQDEVYLSFDTKDEYGEPESHGGAA